jgi:hypothetical protein
MKVAPSFSVRIALAVLYVYASGGLVAAVTCDEAVFGTQPQFQDVLDRDFWISVGLAPGSCTGEGLFQMPRMTWTIEPNQDDSVNTTSVFFSPSNVGSIVTDEYSHIRGIEIDRAVAANATEIGVLIQAPKDGLGSVRVSEGAPSFVNIIKGFTRLNRITSGGPSGTCYQARDGSIDTECPKCDDLYTFEEVKGIGSTIVADLSDVNVEDTTYGSMDAFIYGKSVDNLSLTLPKYGENGVPVDFDFASASSKIEIKGSFDCAYRDYSTCRFRSSRRLDGCKDCSNEMIIDGSINGYFNVSSEVTLESPLDVKISDGGCDHVTPLFGRSSNMNQVTCTEGNAIVNVEPFPCVSADIGTLECGGTNPLWRPDKPDLTNCDYCVVPLPARECSSGPSLGADRIVYLLLPIAAMLLAF